MCKSAQHDLLQIKIIIKKHFTFTRTDKIEKTTTTKWGGYGANETLIL